MGPPSYMRYLVTRNVLIRRMTVFRVFTVDHPPINSSAEWTSGPPEAAVSLSLSLSLSHTHTHTHTHTHKQFNPTIRE